MSGELELRTHATAAEFLATVRPALGEREAEHHLLLGVAEAIAARDAPNGLAYAATVGDDVGLVLAALMSERHPLLVASVRESISSAGELLCDSLASIGHSPRHVIGAVGLVDVVAEAWTRLTKRAYRIAMRQRVYKLTAVTPPPTTSGELRVATEADLDLLTEWITAFEREALAAIATPAARGAAERKISGRELYVWCDPEPRTMAGSARPTKHAIAVNAVYTPPEWRRRGYATACVAALSSVLLHRGFDFCVLYTDLANPTSNAIYTRIGYRPVRDFLMYELDQPSA